MKAKIKKLLQMENSNHITLNDRDVSCKWPINLIAGDGRPQYLSDFTMEMRLQDDD